MTAVMADSCMRKSAESTVESIRMRPAVKRQKEHYVHVVVCDARAIEVHLPFDTSISMHASSQMLCGGRQSSRFTSEIVPVAQTSTSCMRALLPRELRIGTLMVGE